MFLCLSLQAAVVQLNIVFFHAFTDNIHSRRAVIWRDCDQFPVLGSIISLSVHVLKQTKVDTISDTLAD